MTGSHEPAGTLGGPTFFANGAMRRLHGAYERLALVAIIYITH